MALLNFDQGKPLLIIDIEDDSKARGLQVNAQAHSVWYWRRARKPRDGEGMEILIRALIEGGERKSLPRSLAKIKRSVIVVRPLGLRPKRTDELKPRLNVINFMYLD
ncbi:hypothetical protein EVAR_33415_1 [Eumeta japonica]|uniref:Uncharacterized protein n=1 Tax=Eumeta variegata TaxID=151549 RepID=A0A4C1W4I4_EUMVA|nr:hypothetical protein EVAR_33415_1 [Eumeta japonica]